MEGSKLQIRIGLDGVKLTAVPDESELSKERVYYVYEWFIKDTGQVFYIGKGKGNRYKQDKNSVFLKIKNHFDCDVRFVKKDLTEYEALTLEEELFAIREKEGHVLANIQTPNATGVFEDDTKYQYMVTPPIHINRVDKHYFGIENVFFDPIDKEKLMKTHIHKRSFWGIGHLYANINDNELLTREESDKLVEDLVCKVTTFVEVEGGRVYKSPAKSVKSIVEYGVIPYDSFMNYKEKGYDIYHMIDVLKYIENCN